MVSMDEDIVGAERQQMKCVCVCVCVGGGGQPIRALWAELRMLVLRLVNWQHGNVS